MWRNSPPKKTAGARRPGLFCSLGGFGAVLMRHASPHPPVTSCARHARACSNGPDRASALASASPGSDRSNAGRAAAARAYARAAPARSRAAPRPIARAGVVYQRLAAGWQQPGVIGQFFHCARTGGRGFGQGRARSRACAEDRPHRYDRFPRNLGASPRRLRSAARLFGGSCGRSPAAMGGFADAALCRLRRLAQRSCGL